jgi:hypothetical protein
VQPLAIQRNVIVVPAHSCRANFTFPLSPLVRDDNSFSIQSGASYLYTDMSPLTGLEILLVLSLQICRAYGA